MGWYGLQYFSVSYVGSWYVWKVKIDKFRFVGMTKRVQKLIDKISGEGEREGGGKDYGEIHQKER